MGRTPARHLTPLALAAAGLGLGATGALDTSAGSAVAATPSTRTLVIRGAGFGHGVGMSQFGAYGLALQGADHRAILAHYYRGTGLQRITTPRAVRVLLRTTASSRFTGAARIAAGRELDPAKTYTARPTAGSQVVLSDATGAVVATAPAPLRVEPAAGTTLRLRGKAANGLSDGRYRGAFELRPTTAGRMLVVNALGLEDYVRGVVSAESPSDWPAAALEAQAIAARTYAVTTARSVTNGFDQFADTRSQVYLGIKAETPTTDAAVLATADQLVAYRGKPAVTFFFSTSGGKTENVENVFAGAEPEPWLVSVDDPADALSPVHRWGPLRMSLASATRKLKGLVQGSLRGIRVVRRGASPRVVAADLVGTGGTTRVTGEQLKVRLRLRDTWMSFSLVGANGKTIPMPGGSGQRDPTVTTTTPTVPTTTVPTTSTPTTTTPAPGGGATTPGGGTTTGPPTTGGGSTAP